ncbi:MAG: DUF4147 domain-containing protein [Deltaproteobacteria bacterium]|nr:DUF4147 domain-containing protein [Deltaproteobacteria bacterium]
MSISLDQLKSRALEAFHAGLDQVRPERLVLEALMLEPPFKGQFDLRELVESEEPVHVFSCGKAAARMAEAATHVLSARLARTLCIVPDGTARPAALGTQSVQWIESGHPLPSDRSAAAGLAAFDWMAALPAEGASLLVLLSGGTSALLGMPRTGFSVSDLAVATRLLLESGARINEINTVRKHLCPPLGGGLLKASPSGIQIIVLLISDVPGNDLTTIGSGPFIPDPTTVADARSILDRYQLGGRLPEDIKKLFFNQTPPDDLETLKPGDGRITPTHLVLADSHTLLKAIESQFRDARYSTIIGENEQDTVSAAVESHLEAVERLRREIPEGLVILLSGGELSVKVAGTGSGGRNTHYALEFLVRTGADRLRTGPWVLLSAGSDGRDGLSTAAGALVDSRSYELARQRGLDPAAFLARFDSYSFFADTGGLVTTGATGSNLNDVRMVILG